MDPNLAAALAAAARAFADTLAPPSQVGPTNGMKAILVAGSAESMRHVLQEVLKINDEENRGVIRREMADIAKAAGMDPRGMAGYYTAAARLLEKKKDGRWITKLGRKRLAQLQTELGMPPAA